MATTSRSIKELFLSALEVAVQDRVAWLRRECSDDNQRQILEHMLAAHDSPHSLLDQTAAIDTSPIDEPEAEAPGITIGLYKLLDQIGEGGFGVVYLAEQTEPVRRKVALKIVKPGMDTRQVVARFEAERQALAIMDHPNIAKVFDGGATTTGRPYFVMELVKGVPITEYCDHNHLTPRQRLELFIPVCQAVQHAHQKGVIHRDLKPSNVLISRHDSTPVVKVIDFGIAKALGQELTDKTLFTGVAQMIGTPLYMSPEQAGMSDLDIDTRSDIYSLGVLLYELLTGTTPFTRERFKKAAYDEICRIIREEEPPKPSTRLNNSKDSLPSVSAQRQTEPAKLTKLVRGELDWIVMKALEKDRNRRYETANDFGADVQGYLAGEAVKAVPPSAGYRLRKFARRNRAALVMASVIGGALLTTVVALAVSNWRVHEKQLQTTAALEQTKVEERRKSEQLWHALVAQARAIQLSRRTGQRFKSLEILKQAAELARTLELPEAKLSELRNAAIGALSLSDLRLAEPWIAWPSDAVGVDFDETHTRYVRTDRHGECSIRRFADDAELHRLHGLGAASAPRLSRDGRFLAVTQLKENFATGVAVQLWDLEQSTARKIVSDDEGRYIDFHPGGRQIAVAYNDGSISVFDLPSGRQLNRLPPVDLTHGIVIALHPNEPLVAVCSYSDSGVHLRDLNTGNVLASLPQDSRPGSIAWHPDGRTLAVGLMEGSLIRLYDRATLEVFREIKLDQTVSTLAFNHVGDRLVSTGWGGIAQLLDVNTGTKLYSTTNALHVRRFNPDDCRLAGLSHDGKLGVWQVADSRECRTIVRKANPEKAAYTYSISVSQKNDRLLAAAMTDGFGLWDLFSGKELKFIPTGGAHNRVLFEPSGNLLTLCPAGLFRWPIASNSGEAGRSVVGPPERLPLPPGQALDQSRDGRVIVTCCRAINDEQAGGWIMHADRPNQPIHVDAGADISWIAISPDGCWVVTIDHTTGTSKVWGARDGMLIKTLSDFGNITKFGTRRCFFSPDSRWLSTDLDGGRLYSVRDWELGPRVGGAGTFDRDNNLFGVALETGDIRLIVPATGRELARLEDPSQGGSRYPILTPDGTKLIAATGGNFDGIRVRDLRLIRQQLAKMSLDWDAPPFPPVDPRNTVDPLTIEARLGDLPLTRDKVGTEIDPRRE